mgnify:CR=1 FL=1
MPNILFLFFIILFSNFAYFIRSAEAQSLNLCSGFYSTPSSITEMGIVEHFQLLKSQLKELNSEYDFTLSVTERNISRGTFSFESWEGFHLEIYAISSKSSENKNLYAAVTVAKKDLNIALLENLETHALQAEYSPLYAFNQTNQSAHQGVSLKEFNLVKNWIFTYLKANGFSTIASVGQISFSVARFYRYLGMKPTSEIFYEFENYVKYLFGECKKVDCGNTKTMEDLSQSLSTYYFPVSVIERFENFFKNNMHKKENSFVELVSEIKKYTGIESIDISPITDTKNSIIGIKVNYENKVRTFFIVPPQLKAYVNGEFLTWDGIGTNAKFMLLDL